MQPHPMIPAAFSDDDSETSFISGKTLSSTSSLMQNSFHPLQECGCGSASSGRDSQRLRQSHQLSLSQQAFKVHRPKQVDNDTSSDKNPAATVCSGPSTGELERELTALKLELAKAQCDASKAQRDASKAQCDASKAQADARKYKARYKNLAEENSRLEDELRGVKTETKQHKSLAKKLVQENARFVLEANERKVDAQRLSDLARKVQILAAAEPRRRASMPGATVEDPTQLDAVNLASENKQLQLENTWLRREVNDMKAANAAARNESQSRGELHRGLKKVASLLQITDTSEQDNRFERSAEDFLWDDQ